MRIDPLPSRPLCGRIPGALAALAFLLIATVASAAHVQDGGGFFSAKAVSDAEQKLAGLSQGGGANVVIETFNEPPGATRDQIINAPDANSRTQAFERLMQDRAQATNADVYVLANRTPSQVRIIERRQIQQRGLPAAERDRVAQAIVGAFRAKDFDRGLSEGVGMLTSALAGSSPAPAAAGRSPSPAPAPSPSSPSPSPRTPDDSAPMPLPGGGGATASRGLFGGSCCTIIGIGLLVVIVISVVRRMSNRGGGGGPMMRGGYPQQGGYPPGSYPQQGGYPPQYPQQGGGGGFGRGVAGGLLGGVLGSVLGNQMSRGHDGGGHTADPNAGGHPGGGVTPDDTGYTSSSGGDFGNDAGGGSDFTSSSGGDFGGGGDSGGGGGDSGGSSGGDF